MFSLAEKKNRTRPYRKPLPNPEKDFRQKQKGPDNSMPSDDPHII
jgi:hypothetical protein